MVIRQIENPTQSQIDQISELHFSELANSYFNSFGGKLVKSIYQTSIRTTGTFLIILEDDGNVVGYALATSDYVRFKFELLFSIIKDYPLIGLRILITVLVTTPFKTITFKKSSSKLHAELQFIAIAKRYQRKGWGKQLIKQLEDIFRQTGVDMYGISIRQSNAGPIHFYIKQGFQFNESFQFNGDSFIRGVKLLD